MLCCSGCLRFFPGGRLALVGSLVDALPPFGSLADTLPPLLLNGLLCRRPLRYCILFLQAKFVGFRCRGQSPSFVSFFLVLSFYPRSLTTSLVTCNMCYEGSLVAASCNSLCLMKNWLYSSVEKKICNGFSRVMLGASRPSPRGRHVGGPDIEKLPFLSAPL